MTRNLFHGARVRQLHKERRRKADRALKMDTAIELLDGLKDKSKADRILLALLNAGQRGEA
jgi:hypothetical protein